MFKLKALDYKSESVILVPGSNERKDNWYFVRAGVIVDMNKRGDEGYHFEKEDVFLNIASQDELVITHNDTGYYEVTEERYFNHNEDEMVLAIATSYLKGYELIIEYVKSKKDIVSYEIYKDYSKRSIHAIYVDIKDKYGKAETLEFYIGNIEFNKLRQGI